DADRCLAVDEKGNLLDGDQMIAALAYHLKEQGRLPGDTAVVTVMSNLGFFRFCEEKNIHTVSTKVGDRYVLEEMRRAGYELGGEQSGHIILSHYATTGDGQLSAIQLLTMARQHGWKLSRVGSLMERYPQVMVNVRANAEQKKQFQSSKSLQTTIKAADDDLGQTGRVLVRVSGTEPLIRIMVEGKDFNQINALALSLADTIRKELG
ncbi:MAG: phosphoglucosamine mutase, partial [Clostridia bacterium]|nr:phosphoglucosamine mutase [Clostridia bacterium]